MELVVDDPSIVLAHPLSQRLHDREPNSFQFNKQTEA